MINYKGMEVITMGVAEEFGWTGTHIPTEIKDELFKDEEGSTVMMLRASIPTTTLEKLAMKVYNFVAPCSLDDCFRSSADMLIDIMSNQIQFNFGFLEFNDSTEMSEFLLAVQSDDYLNYEIKERVFYNFQL